MFRPLRCDVTYDPPGCPGHGLGHLLALLPGAAAREGRGLVLHQPAPRLRHPHCGAAAAGYNDNIMFPLDVSGGDFQDFDFCSDFGGFGTLSLMIDLKRKMFMQGVSCSL